MTMTTKVTKVTEPLNTADAVRELYDVTAPDLPGFTPERFQVGMADLLDTTPDLFV